MLGPKRVRRSVYNKDINGFKKTTATGVKMRVGATRPLLVLALVAITNLERGACKEFQLFQYRNLHDYAEQFAVTPPPEPFNPTPFLPSVIKILSGTYAIRTGRQLLRNPLIQNTFVDSTGLRFFKIEDAKDASTAVPMDAFDPEFYIALLASTLYVTCDDCDTPYVYDIPVIVDGKTVSSGSMAIWCRNSVLGHSPQCRCNPLVVRPACPTGTYRSRCRPEGGLGECVPCTNGGVAGAVYTSAGKVEANDCKFACPSGFFFDKQDQGFDAAQCRPCTVCGEGQYVAKACTQKVGFTDTTSTDTQCRPCALGQTTLSSDNTRCTPCGFGNRARTDGPGCIACERWQYTPTTTSTVCLACDVGFDSPDRRTCTPCPAGSFRGSNESACTACGIGSAQPEPGASQCELCIDGYANTTGMTACALCPAGQYPNPTKVEINATSGATLRVEGSSSCVPCDRRRVPADATVFRFNYDCSWTCVDGYYQDLRDGECISCAVPCTAVGTQRPECDGSETRLPACVACEFPAGSDMAARTRGVHYEYTTEGTCDYECLPGYNRATNCTACSNQAPGNGTYTGELCAIKCNRGFRGATCIECTLYAHPRTLREALTFPPYFGDNDSVVDFAACNDADAKEFGVEVAAVTNGVRAGCGNGVLERKYEQCDDGNGVSGDGCSSACRLEGGFRSCWVIGSPCEENCGFTADEMYAHYLTDADCSTGLKPTDDLRLCGEDCTTPRLPFEQCNATNRGCVSCTPETQFVNTETQGCSECGSDCNNGFYATGVCTPVVTGFDYVSGAQRLTDAQRGCYPCINTDVAAGAAAFIAPGTGTASSCPYACTQGSFYCTAGFDAGSRGCNGTCSPCTDPAEKVCGAGFYATGCSETLDARCETCGVAREGSYWLESDTVQCAWECLPKHQKVTEIDNGICDPCTTDKTCTDYRYTAVPCDGETSIEAPGRYCKRCPDPTEDMVGVEAVGSNTGACAFDCILHQFFSPNYPQIECARCMGAAACDDSQRYVRCSRREDSFCVPCENQDTVAAALQEFYVPIGSVPRCDVRCQAGYAQHPTTLQCTECASLCDGRSGMRPAYTCEAVSERAALPECVPCDDALTQIPANAYYLDRCAWLCDAGYYFYRVASEPPQCRKCLGCAVGAYPISSTCSALAPSLACVSCTNIPENAIPTSSLSADCPWICAPGYYEVRAKDGSRVLCAARWIVRNKEWDVPNATTSTTLPPPTTPPPPPESTPSADPLPDFPKRRFRTSAAARATRVRLAAEATACATGCLMTQPLGARGSVMDWIWCSSLCVLAIPLIRY